jgi:two-component system response regulator FixJ
MRLEDVTILVVDDDPAVRDSLGLLLETRGVKAVLLEKALDFIDAAKGVSIGCGIVDVGLPDINGIVLQELLAKQGITLPIIIVTGQGDVPMAVKAMRAGAVDFLEKPYSEEALMASVERAVALSRPRPSAAVPSGAAERLARLTPRERDVLNLLVKGEPNKIIAYNLGISPRTVELHRARVMEKLEAKSLPELVRLAIAAGIAGAEG